MFSVKRKEGKRGQIGQKGKDSVCVLKNNSELKWWNGVRGQRI